MNKKLTKVTLALIFIFVFQTAYAGNNYNGICYVDLATAADAEISQPPHTFGGALGLYGAISFEPIDYRTVQMTYEFNKIGSPPRLVKLTRRYYECELKI